MLTVEKFKELLGCSNHLDSLHVAVDTCNANQLYIVANGGMGNTMSFPIEVYPPEIKRCVVSMIRSGELIKNENENENENENKNLLLDINVLVHCLTVPATLESDV